MAVCFCPDSGGEVERTVGGGIGSGSSVRCFDEAVLAAAKMDQLKMAREAQE